MMVILIVVKCVEENCVFDCWGLSMNRRGI